MATMSVWLPDYPGLGHRNDDTSYRPPQQQEPDDPPPAYAEIQTFSARDAPREPPIIESVTFGVTTWPDSIAPYMVLNTHQPSNPEKKRMDMVYKIRYGTNTYDFILYWYPPPILGLPVNRVRRAEQKYLEHFENLWMGSRTPETSPSFFPMLRQLDEAILHSMCVQKVHLEQSGRHGPWRCQIVDEYEDLDNSLHAMVWAEGWADHRHPEVLAVAVCNGSDVQVIHEDRPSQ
ncbi:hypothetical protein BDP55DRAFT_397208 [Colletotrichum godetiae]|uniref:Uncharacterized protein n=1 Tax=Colletotrichum godetiae TaxID=1209918 RepID=A0AAJ0A8G4_9PEZI|nr:uncharacterized protein BDP55DRAFT_397208 [Colletotrichum godetiae]KAK1658461.1 hypothetical protein BDP55DRAFT_397208 [Colletotrichum godetiae]